MNARLLQNLWKLPHLRVVSQRLSFPSFQTIAKSYATTGGASLNMAIPQQNFAANKLNGRSREKKPKEKTISVAMQLARLESQFRQHGNLNYELFGKLLELLESEQNVYNKLLLPEQAHFLLGACGSMMPAQRTEERLQLFQRLWQYLAQHDQLTAEHYKTHLQVLQQNCAPLADFRGFIQNITKLDATASKSVDVYAQLLEVACYNGNMQQATEVLAKMRDLSLALNERNFNALIVGNAYNRDLDGCTTVINSMQAAGVPLSLETHSVLVLAYLVNENSSKAKDILKKHQRQFNTTHILKILRAALSVELDKDITEHLVRELPAEFQAGEVPVDLRNLCIELLHKGKIDTVITIISTLPKPSFNENQNIDSYGVFLLQELFRVQLDITKIVEISQMLCDSEKNIRALHISAEIAMRRSPPLALPLLQTLAKVETLRPHYFWPLMMYNFRRHGESGIFRTLKHMSHFNVTCDSETLKEYVLPRVSVTLENPQQALKMFEDAGLKTSQVLTPTLSHMLAQQQLDEITKLLELYPTRLNASTLVVPLSNLSVHIRATKRYNLFAKILAALAKKNENPKVDFVGQMLLEMLHTQSRLLNDLDAFQRFIGEMQRFGLTISPAAVELLQTTLQQQNADNTHLTQISKTLQRMCNSELAMDESAANPFAPNSSSFIKHPRDMTLEELEYHLIELEAKSLNTRGVLRRLLQLCVRDGRLERALEIKSKCDALNVQVSPGMMASIFDMYIKLKDLPNATQSLEKLRQMFPGFQIDSHKMIDFGALLVHEQQLDLAMQLLKELSTSSKKLIGGDYVLKNIWNFLTNVAQLAARTPTLSKESNLTRDTFVELQKLGYCSSKNAILGPIVRERLLRGDLPAAIAEFRQLSEQYKHTPLQFELLSLLVRLSNSNATELELYPDCGGENAQRLLSDVTAIISKVHGVVNMNSSLLLAFAESGTENQLRRLLINPEFRINQDLLLKNCDHLGQDGATRTLLRLARGARGLHNVIDEQSVYLMLLNNFTKANNYAAALDLFERLEADDELKISQEFLRSLVNLLQVNNVEIPSNIALRAQVI